MLIRWSESKGPDRIVYVPIGDGSKILYAFGDLCVYVNFLFHVLFLKLTRYDYTESVFLFYVG